MSQPPILLVTGGSRGIGAATAKLAASRGFDIAVNYVRDRDAAEAVVSFARDHGRKAIAVQGDMAREDDIERMFAAVDKDLGPVTHLVYNSGMTGKPSTVAEADASTFREVLDLNVFGALLVCRAAIRRMARNRGGAGGSIVLLSSAAATIGSSGEYVWYAASKGAIDSMTIGLAREVAGQGIRVNAVAPGLIQTEIHSPGRVEKIAPTIPLGRAGDPAEVAEVILFLLSEAASYMTGSILRVSGGR